MGEFNSDNHYIYYYGQESLRRNKVDIIVNKRVKCSTWMQSQKQRMISVCFQGKSFNHSNPSLCPDQLFWRSLSWAVLWRPTRPSKINMQKRCPFQVIRGWNASRKSRNTEVIGKFYLGVWNDAGKRLIELCQEKALVIANTLFQKHKRWLYTWTSSGGQYQSQTDYILCSQRWRSSIQSGKQDQDQTVAQIMNSLLSNWDLNWRK